MLGTTIAHYKITAKLGQGGMGEVYRATDTKLDREVAIKVLPQSFAEDKERLARFEREAKTLATLNHPNIAGIYGLEKSDQSQALVLELVEGEDLSERLRRGPLPVEETLEICKQIAEALEAAHEKGIIHRDLKPGNIKITEDGKVKVLDFGLAKGLSDETDSPISTNDENSPTITDAFTQPGTILGTAAYMSPEQARGKQVDKRTDIWAFGCVLYECLTGKKAFLGEDTTETLAGIIKGEPAWQSLPSEISPNISLLLRKCLAKHRHARLHDIADARIDLEQSSTITHESWTNLNIPQNKIGANRLKGGLLALLLMVMSGALTWWGKPTLNPSKPKTIHSDLILSEEFEFRNAPMGNEFALSSDGSLIAYHLEDDLGLHIYDFESGTETILDRTENWRGLNYFFSPKNDKIGFQFDDKIMWTPIDTWAPQEITSPGFDWFSACLGMDWSPANEIVFAQMQEPLRVVSFSNGQITPLMELNDSVAHKYPQFLSQGNMVLFIDEKKLSQNKFFSSPAILDRNTKVIHHIDLPGCLFARYVESEEHLGYLIYAIKNNVYSVRFNLPNFSVIGEPILISKSVRYRTRMGRSLFEVSDNGTFAFVPGINEEKKPERTLYWVDPSGEKTPFAQGKTGNWDRSYFSLSPDERSVALIRDDTRLEILRKHQDDHVTLLPLFDEGVNVWVPKWSKDAQHIFFGAERGEKGIWRMRSDFSSTEPTLIFKQDVSAGGVDGVSGEFLLLSNKLPGKSWDTWRINTNGSTFTPEPFLQQPYDEYGATISKDERWVTFVATRQKLKLVYLTSIDGTIPATPLSDLSPIRYPQWSAKSDQVYFQYRSDIYRVKFIEQDGAIKSGKPEYFLTLPPMVSRGWRISQDGTRCLVMMNVHSIQEDEALGTDLTEGPKIARLKTIHHWFTDLEKLSAQESKE
jgi:serine/threonine-protein kinase